MAKKTPAQLFAAIFARFTAGSTPDERATAEKAMDAWLKKRGKSRIDIQVILHQASLDDAAAAPPPPPSDPRDTQAHPFEDPRFTPAGLVHGIAGKYLAMTSHAAVIYALWICFTHVHTQFRIAPRVALVSERPDSGKTTALDLARCLVWRPNPEALGTGAAVTDFLDQGPGTVLLDELDHADKEAQRRLRLIWNLGHKRGAQTSLMVRGRRRLLNLFAPMMAAGIGAFLGATQQSRAFILEMTPYTAQTKPEREFDENDTAELDAVYSYLRHWASTAKLSRNPPMPAGVIRRYADNVRGLLAIAHSCGPEWEQWACEAITVLLAREKAERPEIAIVRHGLAILDALGLDQIGSVRFNKELRQLDLPDARWARFRGPSGLSYDHPIELFEQAQLLALVGIESKQLWLPGKRESGGKFRGYTRAQFEEAWRKHGAVMPGGGEPARLHLVPPPPE
jgi:hypothetical protein